LKFETVGHCTEFSGGLFHSSTTITERPVLWSRIRDRTADCLWSRLRPHWSAWSVTSFSLTWLWSRRPWSRLPFSYDHWP